MQVTKKLQIELLLNDKTLPLESSSKKPSFIFCVIALNVSLSACSCFILNLSSDFAHQSYVKVVKVLYSFLVQVDSKLSAFNGAIIKFAMLLNISLTANTQVIKLI